MRDFAPSAVCAPCIPGSGRSWWPLPRELLPCPARPLPDPAPPAAPGYLLRLLGSWSWRLRALNTAGAQSGGTEAERPARASVSAAMEEADVPISRIPALLTAPCRVSQPPGQAAPIDPTPGAARGLRPPLGTRAAAAPRHRLTAGERVGGRGNGSERRRLGCAGGGRTVRGEENDRRMRGREGW